MQGEMLEGEGLLGKRGPRAEGMGRERKDTRWHPQAPPRPAGTPPAPACGQGSSLDTFWPQGHKEAGEALSRCPSQSVDPCTCHRSGPGVSRGPVPVSVLNELPAYLHVLINHQMSPRGSIKLSVSLCFLPLPPLTQGSPPLHSRVTYAPGLPLHLFLRLL